MKKLLTLIFICLSLLGYAQQKMRITNMEGVPYTDGQIINVSITENDLNPITEAFHFDIIVENLAENNLRMKSVCSGEMVDGMEIKICFDLDAGCLDGPPLPIEISSTIPYQEKQTYEVALDPKGFIGLNELVFEFFAEGESITIYANIEVVRVGVNEQKQNAVSLNAFPNPATEGTNITISYTLPNKNNSNKLVIRNMLGTEVIHLPLNPLENKVSVDITSLVAGVYFYTIENNNQIFIAKKLIVN